MHSPGLSVLCLTWWSVRAESLQSVLDNFTVLLTLKRDLTQGGTSIRDVLFFRVSFFSLNS